MGTVEKLPRGRLHQPSTFAKLLSQEKKARPHAPGRPQRHPLLPAALRPAAGRHRGRHAARRGEAPLHPGARRRPRLRPQHRGAGLPPAHPGGLRGKPAGQRVRGAERGLPAAHGRLPRLRRAAGVAPLRLHLRQPGTGHLPGTRLAHHHRRRAAVGGKRRL